MFATRVLVEIIEVLLAPVTTIRSPAFLAWLHPCIHSLKSSGVLRGRLILINHNWRCLPCLAVFDHTIPIDVSLLGKDENHGMAVERQIRFPMFGRRTDVRVVRFIES